MDSWIVLREKYKVRLEQKLRDEHMHNIKETVGKVVDELFEELLKTKQKEK